MALTAGLSFVRKSDRDRYGRTVAFSVLTCSCSASIGIMRSVTDPRFKPASVLAALASV